MQCVFTVHNVATSKMVADFITAPQTKDKQSCLELYY